MKKLKSKKENTDNYSTKVNDGVYRTMIDRITSLDNPSFFFMHYDNYEVNNLIIVPKCFFVPEDENQNIFGGYCSKEIGIWKYHFDSEGYLFSLMRNGKISGKKYLLKNSLVNYLKINYSQLMKT